MSDYVVRKFENKDLKNIVSFFKKAYGEDTVFADESFLRWYYSSLNDDKMMQSCIIALDENNEIVSHYGGLNYFLRINDKVEPIVWGVNAYTLVEHRGKNINSKIVEKINNEFNFNGIIGFTDKTAKFYENINYNIFNYEKFKRFIYTINFDKTKKIIEFLGFQHNIINEKSYPFKLKDDIAEYELIKIDKKNFKQLEVDFINISNIFATTLRDKEFINRRILNNPFIEYQVWGIVRKNALKSYIVYRRETLMPLGIVANRIIDLYGSENDCSVLLNKIISISKDEDCAYIEFSMFGFVYKEILKEEGFFELKDDESEIIPFCSSPMERRSNNERVGFSSIKYNELIKKMSVENVYFTRIDSDRDRLAKISQIKF